MSFERLLFWGFILYCLLSVLDQKKKHVFSISNQNLVFFWDDFLTPGAGPLAASFKLPKQREVFLRGGVKKEKHFKQKVFGEYFFCGDPFLPQSQRKARDKANTGCLVSFFPYFL